MQGMQDDLSHTIPMHVGCHRLPSGVILELVSHCTESPEGSWLTLYIHNATQLAPTMMQHILVNVFMKTLDDSSEICKILLWIYGFTSFIRNKFDLGERSPQHLHGAANAVHSALPLL